MKFNNFEIILFDKYLIRTDEYNYRLSVLRDDCKPIVKRKIKTIKGKDREFKDYSNFGNERYYGNLKGCLKQIKDYELKSSQIETIDDLVKKIDEINDMIDGFISKFTK